MPKNRKAIGWEGQILPSASIACWGWGGTRDSRGAFKRRDSGNTTLLDPPFLPNGQQLEFPAWTLGTGWPKCSRVRPGAQQAPVRGEGRRLGWWDQGGMGSRSPCPSSMWEASAAAAHRWPTPRVGLASSVPLLRWEAVVAAAHPWPRPVWASQLQPQCSWGGSAHTLP